MPSLKGTKTAKEIAVAVLFLVLDITVTLVGGSDDKSHYQTANKERRECLDAAPRA
jgi:hypothetical protein